MGTSQVPSRAEVVCTNTHYDPKDLSHFPEIDREARELWEKSQVKLLNLNIHSYPTLADALGQPAEI
jgi:hypothetical protein